MTGSPCVEDLAGVGLQDAEGDPHRGGLAGAVGADEADDLAIGHRKRQSVERNRLAVAARQVAKFEHYVSPALSRRCLHGPLGRSRAVAQASWRVLSEHVNRERENYDLPKRPPLPFRQAAVMFGAVVLALGLWFLLPSSPIVVALIAVIVLAAVFMGVGAVLRPASSTRSPAATRSPRRASTRRAVLPALARCGRPGAATLLEAPARGSR